MEFAVIMYIGLNMRFNHITFSIKHSASHNYAWYNNAVIF